MNSKRSQLFKIFIIALVFISLGYAALTTFIKIDSHVELGKTAFTIHFDNIGETTHKATVNATAAFTDGDTKKNIGFEVSLPKVGDFYAFTTDIVNESTLPAKISTIELSGLTDSQKRILQYKAYYSDSKREVTVGDFIGPETTKNITFEIRYRLSSDVVESDLPTSTIGLDGVFTINYENVDPEEYKTNSISNRFVSDKKVLSSNVLDFTKRTSTDEYQGLYLLESTSNDDYPIYFYRGVKESIKNHLIFGNTCWRIIRTTETGGIKLIFNGYPDQNGKCSAYGVQLESHQYSNIESWDWTTSTIKTYLYTWYFEHLNDYNNYIEDTNFCNDNKYENGSISLSCDQENIVSVANGKNTYPVGMITAEEANMAGSTIYSSTTVNSWLYTNDNTWTMSGKKDSDKYMWTIAWTADLGSDQLSTSSVIKSRPVISLNRDVTITDGDGTYNNPYIVSTNL